MARPDKWQKILQMVFRSRGLQINPVGDRAISTPRGGDVTYLRSRFEKPIYGKG